MTTSKSHPTSAPKTNEPNTIYPQNSAPSVPTDDPPPYTPNEQLVPHRQDYGSFHMNISHPNTDIPLNELRDRPAIVICPHCHRQILTRTTYKVGSATYLWSTVLCLLGITACGFCLVPCCVGSAKDVEHHCPKCRKTIARFNRLDMSTTIYNYE